MMNLLLRTLVFTTGWLMLLATLQAADREVTHVVLVSVDGLSASYLTDPRAEMPNLRAIAAQGVSAAGMLTSFPSVTWPSHTSLITGVVPARHGVIGNDVWNRKLNQSVVYIGDPTLTKEEAIRVPTLYDVAHESGLTTAGIIWPCSNGAKTLNWMIPDSNKPELHARYTTPGMVAELAQAGIDISQLGQWGWDKQFSTQRDLAYTQVAKYLLTRHKVNLVLLHLITPDGVEHAFGPSTPEAYQAVAESDQRIGEIWQTLQQPPLAGRSALFVVSDHGFAPYQKLIRPNAVLKELGLIAADDQGKVTDRAAWCVAQGGSAFIYVLDDDRREELTSMLAKKLAAIEGVLSVVEPSGFAELGVPDPQKNPEAPHLILTTGPGYSFAGDVAGLAITEVGGTKGSHGHDPRPDYMHATFVAAGTGIRSSVKLKTIRNVDVAPTIAHLLGFEMQGVDGKVLRDALTN
jgi:predicted AlkP superfamily pyrophosphatase or phosphodiesterase